MALNVSGVSLDQLAGNHQNHYANLWRKYCDLSQQRVAAQMGAALLKTSALPDATLREIWELADYTKSGTLDQKGFYLALHLIALTQSGALPKVENVSAQTAAPRFQDLSDNVSPADWAESEKKFSELPLQDGFVSGNSVKPMMLSSGLPPGSLARIWQMVDTDSDGKLRVNEFCVAMFLIKQCADGANLPQNLPSSLFIRPSALPSSPGPAPGAARRPEEFIVSASALRKYGETFRQYARSGDLISGAEAREVFKLSKLPVAVLADVWNLCSKRKPGFLSLDEFSLAMMFIEGKMQGRDLPASIAADFRLLTPGSAGALPGTHPRPRGPKDYSSIKELDTFENEVKDLDEQVVSLTQDVSHTQLAVEQKTAGLKDIQVKLSTATSERMLLERTRADLSGRVEELDRQHLSLSSCLREVQERCRVEEEEIRGLERELLERETTYKSRQDQLGEMRRQVSALKNQQSQLETQVEEKRRRVAEMSRSVDEAQRELNREQFKLKPLQDEESELSAQVKQLAILEAQTKEPAAAGQIVNMSERDDLPEDFSSKDGDVLSVRATAGSSPVSSISNVSAGSAPQLDDPPAEDEFNSRPGRARENGILKAPGTSNDRSVKFADQVDQISRPEGQGDPFKSDPFADSSAPFADSSAPFADSSAPFADSSAPFVDSSAPANTSTDPFAIMDPFSAASDGQPTFSRSDLTFDPFQADSQSFPGGVNPFVSLELTASNPESSQIVPDPLNSDPNPEQPVPVPDPFNQDPFQDGSKPEPTSQVRAQGFDTDPFGGNTSGFGDTDPFGAPDTSTFGTDPFNQPGGSGTGGLNLTSDPFESDPFGTAQGPDPFATDPFTT